MRFKVLMAVGWLALALPATGDEKLPVLQVGADVYSNVTVMTVSATDVYFTYVQGKSVGMANAKLKNLTPELQRHFNYNPTNAMAVARKQSQANAQYRSWAAGQPALPPPDETRSRPAPAALKVLWRTDLPGALTQAQSENKKVLLDFTGSDWCAWCIQFDQDVLSTSSFNNYAGTRLVLVKLDYPRSTPQSDGLRRANAELLNRFHVDGYPTFILLNAAGQELGRQVGYLTGGPNAFIEELERFSHP